jgi:pSer/pThr/pTyr-binding forkhead associated (FHA) protein/Mg-chelatase subunit ChlD
MILLRKCFKVTLYFYFILMGFTIMAGSFGIMCSNTAHADPDHALDLVFVIDNSGSMKKNDPNFITPQVVSTFVRQLANNTQVGVVLFDQKARLLIPMTLISSATAQQKVINSLKKIDYRGQFTNTPIGIERALYELKTNGRAEAQKGIIFVTDGIVDTGNKLKDQELTQWLKKDITAKSKLLGIRIFGIALTEAADYSLIQTLAAKTDGEYFRTFEAGEISGVLKQIKLLMTPPKPEPAPELAPLPLLPVPEEKTQAEPDPAEPVQVQKPPSRQSQLPDENEKVKETGKGFWMIAFALALVAIALIGALAFFFYQNMRSRQTGLLKSDKDIMIPEAYLENSDHVQEIDRIPYKIEKDVTNIGRSKRNDLVIEEPAISSFHATIEYRNMYFYLEDQRSTNGTLVNDQKLSANDPVRLKSGDCISFAKFKFIFNITNQIPFGDTVLLSRTALEDPDAEATVVLDLENANSKQGLMSCIQNHLIQIYGLSPKHKEYVNTYFAAETLDIIATTAHKNLQKTVEDGKQYCTPIIKNKAFFIICTLPASIESASQWYGKKHKGFTQFIFKWIRSEHYKTAECEQLCIVTFGQDPATWVSITIVPTHSQPDPIEIMSVDFLNEEEKASLALDFDNHGRVI